MAVTGATGFIGLHLVPALVATGRQVVMLARPGREPDRAGGSDHGIRRVVTDLGEEEGIRSTLEREKPAVVIHLAGTRGRSDVRGCWMACADINVGGTARLLMAATRVGVCRVVIVGSADEYGHQSGPVDEGCPLLPASAYAVTKAAATRLAQAMHEAEGCPVVIVRPFSVYGPGQRLETFLGEAVNCAVTGRPFRMSEGRQRRDFVFASDVAAALVAAATVPGVEGRVFNVGSGQAHALRDVARLVWDLSGSTAPLLIGERPAAPGELHDTWADMSLTRRLLAWQPRIDLVSGLRATIEWARTRGGAAV